MDPLEFASISCYKEIFCLQCLLPIGISYLNILINVIDIHSTEIICIFLHFHPMIFFHIEFSLRLAIRTHINNFYSEIRIEGLETLDYLDNLFQKERFTEQGDAITFESEVNPLGYICLPHTHIYSSIM